MRFPSRTAALIGAGVGVIWLAAGPARGQAPAPAQVRVETAPLDLVPPARFDPPILVEPGREVDLVPLADGVVTLVQGQVGEAVRERQEVAQLDRAEAAALLKVAQAELKEQEAAAKANRGASGGEVFAARVEAAQARVELAQIAVDRCTIRAPFAGRLLEVRATPGQFVERGRPVALLADTSTLRAIVPVERGTAPGATLALTVEGRPVEAKVRSVIPLPDAFAGLRELHAPLAAAWVELPNPDGSLEPGQRLRTPLLPDAPLAVIPSQALRQPQPPAPAPGNARGSRPNLNTTESAGGGQVQILRNERVVDLAVRVLGPAGPDRVQVSGPFRGGDALIVWSSTPLMAGALVRFPGAAPAGIEAYPPSADQPGAPAQFAGPPAAPAPAPVAAQPPPAARPQPAAKAATAPPGVPF